MLPKSMSASAVQNFEGCPARWKADYVDRAGQINNTAASLGTACHGALDCFVGTVDMHDVAHNLENGTPADKKEITDYLVSLYSDEYWRLFSTPERFDEGAGLLGTWLERQTTEVWVPERTVISREVKRNFMLKAQGQEVPFNYIMDRVDRIEVDGGFEIEVVDYKTTALPLNPKMLKHKVQARCYGVAAQIEYPEAKRIWVTFDQLRHDPVGIVFTRDENVATWKYLRGVLSRMLDTPAEILDPDGNVIGGPPEMLNPECRWCTRAPVCATLASHEYAGGILSITDPYVAASRLTEIEAQMGGLATVRAGLEEFLLAHMSDEESLEEHVGDLKIEVTSGRGRREVDSDLVKGELPPEIAAEYGKIGVTQVDKILKDGRISDEAKANIKRLVRKNKPDPKIKVTKGNPIDEDD